MFLIFFFISSQTLINKKKKLEILHEKIYDFIYIIFYVQYFKKVSETPLYTQELQYASDFSTASSSSVLDDTENLQKEIPTLESLYEAPLDMHELEYLESQMSSYSTEDRSESFSN